MTPTRTFLTNHHHLLKLIALIAAYNLWILYRQPLSTSVTVPLTVYFYNTPAERNINTVDQVEATLYGTYSALRSLDKDMLNVHIDASHLHQGTQMVTLDRSTFLLPRNVNVLHYKPSLLSVTVT